MEYEMIAQRIGARRVISVARKQVGIPAKLNASSEAKPNGIPG
jgi:hypothetical protein